MFAEQLQALLNAGMSWAQAQILSRCDQVLRHNGRIYLAPNLRDTGTDGALNIRVGRGKKAIRVTQGDIVIDAPYNTFVFNGQSDTIRFRNDADELAPYGGVMQVSGYIIDLDGRRSLTIEKPSAPATGDDSYPRLYAINCTYPGVLPGAYGSCSRAGMGVVLFDTGTPAFGQAWGAKAGQWSLTTGRDGFTCLGPATGSYILVDQRELTTAMGTNAAADLTQGGNAVITITNGSGTSLGYTVTGYDRLLLSSKKNPQNSTLDLEFRCGKWWVSGAKECPT